MWLSDGHWIRYGTRKQLRVKLSKVHSTKMQWKSWSSQMVYKNLKDFQFIFYFPKNAQGEKDSLRDSFENLSQKFFRDSPLDLLAIFEHICWVSVKGSAKDALRVPYRISALIITGLFLQ